MSRVFLCTVGLLAAAIIGLSSGCGSGSSSSISVSLLPSSPQAIDQGQTVKITATVMNDSSYQGVSWNLAGPGSLAGATTSSVTYTSPTTALTTAQQATVTATSVKDTSKTASVQIAVNLSPQIPLGQTLASGTVGTAYNQSIMLTGGTPPFQWGIYDGPLITGYEVGGSVPDGLTLNASTGAISGTPTGAGTWYFEATLTDATGATATPDGFLSIQINRTAPVGNPVPFLNQTLVPTSVAPGGAGLTLNAGGTGFVSGATVDFNGAPLTTSFIDGEHLSAIVPAANVANAGTASITVVNPSPGGGASNTVYFLVGASEATVSFVNAANSPLQIPGPTGLAIADFNQDGKPDLAVAANVRMYIMLGNGDGTFTSASGSPLFLLSPPYATLPSPVSGPAIALGDFNHSGHLGLAVALTQSEAAAILLGNGNGTFAPSSAAFANTADPTTSALAAADFNADGNVDLAIANQIYGSAFVTLGYGRGAFNAAGNLNTTGFLNAMAVGDFNGDGKLDAIVAGGSGGVSTGLGGPGLGVSLGNGDGTFTPANGSPISLGQSLSAIVAADFNGDGKLDVAVTDSSANDLYILLGNRDGTFGPPSTIAVGNSPDAIVAGDFNNDGKLDLAVANGGDNTVTLLLGNGDGTFTQTSGSPYPVGMDPYQLVAADFNGDGKLDLAVANLFGNTVSILLQQ
jgi:hypothetical protein